MKAKLYRIKTIEYANGSFEYIPEYKHINTLSLYFLVKIVFLQKTISYLHSNFGKWSFFYQTALADSSECDNILTMKQLTFNTIASAENFLNNICYKNEDTPTETPKINYSRLLIHDF
jgi:hypothetical protein